MSVKINLGAWNSVFAVPSIIAENELKNCDGVKLKVLLCVLNSKGNDISYEEISKYTGVNVTDIPEALDFWIDRKILAKSGEEILPAMPKKPNKSKAKVKNIQDENLRDDEEINDIVLDIINENENNKQVLKENKNEIEKLNKVTPIPRPQRPDYVFTTQRLAVDEELKMLVSEAEFSLGKPVSNADVSILLMLKDSCGLPLEVLLMLISYCVSIDRANMRYIEKVGISWSDQGILSVEAADNYIRNAKRSNSNYKTVASVFGLVNVGSPTKKQTEYCNCWIDEWKFSTEMLREAYERAVNSTGKCEFRYINGILKRWYSNKITNIEQLIEFDKNSKSKTPSKNTSYNIDELEKITQL